jgi:D-serine deaminase-like pyridoxal phosphate-dependent protein
MNASELDTPAVYVDLDILERNIQGMQERCNAWGVKLRPHTKTHKIPEIARMQLEAGAVGITVAKIGEAEVLPGDDVLIAYTIMPDKLPRLMELAEKRRVTVVVDSVEAAERLPGIGAMVEVDVGAGRAGVKSADEVVRIAKACSEFRGLFYWPAWLDEEGFKKAGAQIDSYVTALQAAGFDTPVISGGSTPGAPKTPLVPSTTEIRPGTYVFNDVSCVANGFATVVDGTDAEAELRHRPHDIGHHRGDQPRPAENRRDAGIDRLERPPAGGKRHVADRRQHDHAENHRQGLQPHELIPGDDADVESTRQ